MFYSFHSVHYSRVCAHVPDRVCVRVCVSQVCTGKAWCVESPGVVVWFRIVLRSESSSALWTQEAEPQRPQQAEPGQDSGLQHRASLRQLQTANSSPVQLLNECVMRWQGVCVLYCVCVCVRFWLRVNSSVNNKRCSVSSSLQRIYWDVFTALLLYWMLTKLTDVSVTQNHSCKPSHSTSVTSQQCVQLTNAISTQNCAWTHNSTQTWSYHSFMMPNN